MIRAIAALFGGGLGDQLRRAYEARLNAQNDADRLALDRHIAEVQASLDMARLANADRWSARSLGTYLILVPYGLWWAAIYIVQIVNPWFGLTLVVVDVPPHINDMAMVLIPALLLANAEAFTTRRLRGR